MSFNTVSRRITEQTARSWCQRRYLKVESLEYKFTTYHERTETFLDVTAVLWLGLDTIRSWLEWGEDHALA